jgi:hypothetical protein
MFKVQLVNCFPPPRYLCELYKACALNVLIIVLDNRFLVILSNYFK